MSKYKRITDIEQFIQAVKDDRIYIKDCIGYHKSRIKRNRPDEIRVTFGELRMIWNGSYFERIDNFEGEFRSIKSWQQFVEKLKQKNVYLKNPQGEYKHSYHNHKDKISKDSLVRITSLIDQELFFYKGEK